MSIKVKIIYTVREYGTQLTMSGKMKKIHFLLALVLVQCLCCLYAGTAMCQPITLVTLGDSLTAGDGDSTGNGGYPSRLLSLLTPDYPDFTLSKLAISGDTTPDPVSPPIPMIFSGADAGSISVTTSQTVTISVSLDAGSMLNTPGDWWLIHVPPKSPVLSLTGDLRWQETLTPVLSIPLVSFQKIPIFSNILPAPGTHLFFFAVDDNADGRLEAPLWFDGFTVQVSEAAPVVPGDDTERLMPRHLNYKGAFQLPDDFNWGARGLTYYPAGDAGAGSLLVTGFQAPSSPEHPLEPCWNPEWNCHAYYGQVRIPTPVVDADWENLPRAALLGQMTSFDQGLVADMEREYVFVSDIAYVPKSGTQTRDKIYGAADFWYAAGTFGEDSFPTIWMADLNGANAWGMFHVGPDADPYHGRKTGSYLFSAPQWYADRYLGGRTLVTGRSRGTPADLEPITTNGGSQGPTLFAFHPFASENPAGNLDALPMLYYRVKFPGCAGPDIGPTDACDYPGFTMCDDWTGGAFVDDGERRAVMLLGYKGLGNNCYGGDACNNPCSDGQGYHCNPYERQVIFYDVHELGAIARQERDPWSVLPYTVWRPEEFYIQGHTCWNAGGMTFHPASGRLFMVERGLGEGETNAAVVHVWSVQ